MQIAYLISAYQDPEQLARLVLTLRHPAVTFYIHVDKKVSIAPFLAVLPRSEQVHYVENRHPVYWKGFSQVRMMLELMRAAMARLFKYAVYLSEADYPLRSSEAILNFFAQNPPEMISYWKLTDRPAWLHKIRYYYLHDCSWLNPRNSTISLQLFRVYNRTLKLLARRTFPFRLIPYGGAEYFSLSQRAIQYIISYWVQHEKELAWYRWSDSPVEHFFHTILLNSPFREQIIHYELYHEWSKTASLSQKKANGQVLPEMRFHYRYMDWSQKRERPAILDERDFEKLIAADALFARKFTSRRSGKLLDRLDAWIQTTHSF